MTSAPWETYSEQALLDLLLGDHDAARMMLDVAEVSHVYDDLIDGDKTVTPDKVHALVWKLLVSLPTNPFFTKHETVLRPLMIAGILNWQAANQMEQSGSVEELRISHAIRYSIADMLTVSMVLLGGHEYAMKNARRARLLGQNDTWANYLSEHTHAD